jgi:hypothetical protein
MLEWLRDFTAGWPLWGVVLAIVLPVLGFVLVVAGARLVLERLGTKPFEMPRRANRSNIGLSLSDLERLAHDYYKSQGYDILRSGDPDETEGEMVAFKDDQRTLIWCLPGKAMPEPEAVEEIAALRDRLQVQRAVLMAPAGFTSNTRRRAVTLGVELRDKTQIDLMRRMTERRAG